MHNCNIFVTLLLGFVLYILFSFFSLIDYRCVMIVVIIAEIFFNVVVHLLIIFLCCIRFHFMH